MMDDMELIDEMAGGARDDLDDVIIQNHTPVRAVYRVPQEMSVLDFLEQQADEAEKRWIMDRFYDPTQDLSGVNTGSPTSISAVRRMWCEYGLAVYRANPHLTKRTVWRHLRSLGYDGGEWAFYKFTSRAGEANTQRSRGAGAATTNAR